MIQHRDEFRQTQRRRGRWEVETAVEEAVQEVAENARGVEQEEQEH